MRHWLGTFELHCHNQCPLVLERAQCAELVRLIHRIQDATRGTLGYCKPLPVEMIADNIPANRRVAPDPRHQGIIDDIYVHAERLRDGQSPGV